MDSNNDVREKTGSTYSMSDDSVGDKPTDAYSLGQLSDAEIDALRDEHVSDGLPTKANLGCGDDYRPGWHNVDQRDALTCDEYADLDTYPWPWPDDAFEHVLLDNVIEHLDDRHAALHELHRVVETGGSARLRFPHWNSAGHYSTPSHEKTITHRTFNQSEVTDLFDIREVDCQRVRFGRALPSDVALWMADHVGHIVSEVDVMVEVV